MSQENKEYIDWVSIMSSEDAVDFSYGSTALLDKLGILFANVAFLLDELPLDINNKKYLYARPLIVGISSNAKAVIKLARLGFWNELYPIMRSLLERIVTYYYLQYCSEEEFQNYIDYSVQKTYRKFDREIKINDKIYSVKYTGEIDLEKNPELKNIVEKFTSPVSKKPITRWSNTSIEKKLELIDEVGKIDLFLLLVGLESIYDDGSEALHGTLYGCMFHTGAFQPDRDTKKKSDSGVEFRTQLTVNFALFSLLLAELGKYVSKKYKQKELFKKFDDGWHLIKKTLLKMKATQSKVKKKREP
jgi:hypothetical protein